MEEKKLTVKQNMIYNSVGSLTYLVCQWLITIVVVRFSNYENAGILSLAMSINNILYAISTFGLRNYQVSDIKEEYSDFEYIVTRCVTCLISTFACVVFVLFNCTHYAGQEILCIVMYFGFKLTESFIDVLQGIEQKKYRMDFVGKSYIVRAILTLAGFSIVIKTTQNLALSIGAMILANALIAVFYDFRICNKMTKIGDAIQWVKIKKVIIENLPLMANEMLMTSVVSVARYLLEFHVGSKMLGIYASIATPTVIIQAACNMIYSPMITEYAIKYNNRDFKGYSKLVYSIVIVFVGILAATLVGVHFLGDWGLKLLFGEEILAFSYLLKQTMIVTFMVAFMYWLSALMVVARKQKQVMLINGIAVVTVVIASLGMMPKLGIDGINYVLFFALGIDITLLFLLMYKTVKQQFFQKQV